MSTKEKNPELWAKQFGTEAYVEALHKEGCQIMGCVPASRMRAKIECDHHPTRGAGGTWRDMVPLCAYHHRVRHDLGITSFEAFYGINLTAVAAAMVLQHGHLVLDPGGAEVDPNETQYDYDMGEP